MERNANYTLVGFATVFLAVGVIVFAFWLGRFQFNRDFDLYDVIFVGPVNGLSQGSEARFNGIKVGEVIDIDLDPRDSSRVIARVRTASDVPVKTDSFATLEPQNITGVSFVQITAGSKAAPLLKDVTPEDKVPVLRSQSSTLSNLLEGGGTVLASAVEALDRVNRVLSDKNITAFTTTLDDINVVTADIRNQRQVFADARTALLSLNAAATDVSALTKSAETLVNTDAKAALKDVGLAVSEMRATAADARELIATLKGPTSDFANTSLPQLQSAISSLQGAADSLDRLASEIETNPRALIGKEPAKEIELEP